MNTTFSKGDAGTVPAWLADNFIQAKEHGLNSVAPRIRCRIEHTSGEIYADNRGLQEGALGVFGFLSRFVAEASKPGVTLAEIAMTNPHAKPHRNGSTSEQVGQLVGIGLFCTAAERMCHPQGQCPGAAWAVLQVVPVE